MKIILNSFIFTMLHWIMHVIMARMKCTEDVSVVCVSGGAMSQQLQAIQVHPSPLSSDSSPEIIQTSSSSTGTYSMTLSYAQILLWSVTSVRRLLCLSHSKPHRYDSHFLSAFFNGKSHDVPWSTLHVHYIQPYPCRRGSDLAQYLLTSPRHDARVPHTRPRLRSDAHSVC